MAHSVIILNVNTADYVGYHSGFLSQRNFTSLYIKPELK